MDPPRIHALSAPPFAVHLGHPAAERGGFQQEGQGQSDVDGAPGVVHGTLPGWQGGQEEEERDLRELVSVNACIGFQQCLFTVRCILCIFQLTWV